VTNQWQEHSLSDLLEEAKPGFASGENPSDGVFQFRMNNLRSDGRFDFTKKRRVPRDTKKLDSYMLARGDVLFNATNSPELVGKSAFFDGHPEPAVYSNHFIRLRPDRSRLDGRYLARWLQLQFQRRLFQSRCKQWVNQATFGRDALLTLSIPVPPIDEQRRIAAILDRADDLLVKRHKSLILLNSLNEAILQQLLLVSSFEHWPRVRLERIGEVQGGLQVTQARLQNPITVPYLRVANVYRGRIDLGEVKEMRVTAAELERTRLQHEDLLIVEGHGNPAEIGRVGRWTNGLQDCVHQNHLIRLRIDTSQARPRFVEAYLNSPVGRQGLLRAARTTSGLNTISTGDVRSVSLPLPPLDAQDRFDQELARVGLIAAAQEAHLRRLEELFSSLQMAGFRGELSDAR
jgi:type I restriction enzyme, S subunit